jgi:hypothetical protein
MYRVIDLETGEEVNRLAARQLYQFAADLESVWDRVITESGIEHRRFPLRDRGAPWWLWGITLAGAVVVVRDGWQFWRHRKQATASAA